MTVRRLPLLQEPPLVRTSALGALNIISLFIFLPPSCISQSLTFTPASSPVLFVPGCKTWRMCNSTERLAWKREGKTGSDLQFLYTETAVVSRVIIYFLSLAVTWVSKVAQTPFFTVTAAKIFVKDLPLFCFWTLKGQLTWCELAQLC